RMHRLALDDGQPDAAARARLVIGDQIVRTHAVKVSERGEMRLEDDAVPEHHVADAERAEQAGKVGGCRCLRCGHGAGYVHFYAVSTRLPERADAAIASSARMLPTAS